MTWRAAAEQVTRKPHRGIRVGRRVAPPPDVMPALGSLVHAVGEDGMTACGETANDLHLLPDPWPPGNPQYRCPECIVATDGKTGS